MNPKRPITALILALAAGTAGFAVNQFGLPVFGGIEMVFGGAFTLLATYLLGPWWGALATALAYSVTWLTWNHPVGLLCFTLEAFVVGLLGTRRNVQPLVGATLFWALLGVPLISWIILRYTDFPFPANYAIIIKYPVNSLLMALFALPVYYSRRFRQQVGLPLDHDADTPLKIVLFRRFGVILVFTLMVFLILAGRTFERVRTDFAREEIILDGRQVAHQLQVQLDSHQHVLALLAVELAAAHPGDHAAITRRLEQLRHDYPGLLTLLAADSAGRIIAAVPAIGRDGTKLADGRHSVASREYFIHPMATGEAYVGQAEAGQLYRGELILPFSVPVLGRDGRPVLVVKASLNLALLPNLVQPAELIKGRSVLITDQRGRLISRTGYIPRAESGPPLPMFIAARLAGAAQSYTYQDDNLGRLEQFLGTRQIVPGYGWQVYFAEPAWHTTRVIAWFYLITLSGAIAALGLALLFARATADDITRSFTQLVEAIRKFDEEGAPSAFPDLPHASRELGTISRELHGAALSLSRSNRELALAITDRDKTHQQLRQVLLHLEEKVRDRTAELEEARCVAESASLAKSEFLASMSHELRTPLNVILGMSELVLERGLGPLTDRQAEGLQNINESGRHLLDLINDILDLSKIEAGMLDLQLEPTVVSDVCAASLRFVRESAKRKGLQLLSDLRQTTETILADERRLKQILINLLVNAVKFTPAGGRVGLAVTESADDATLCFEVWDTGIGIAPEHFDRIFQPFRQIDSSLARQYTGTGLGLALVRRMTQLHGGTVELTSAPGQGSRFRVLLPLRRPAAAPVAAEPARAAGESFSPLAPVPTRILIAEDNAGNKDVYRSYFQAKNCVLILAANGLEAVERAIQERPDIILMDVHMPLLNGLEAMRRIRADRRTEHIPVIAVTALAMPDDHRNCLEAGACAYLAKPVNLRELGRLIAQHALRPGPATAQFTAAL